MRKLVPGWAVRVVAGIRQGHWNDGDNCSFRRLYVTADNLAFRRLYVTAVITKVHMDVWVYG
jgi:hypothetical protein